MSTIYPSRPIVGVGAVIVCRGKILLEQRMNEPGQGKWSIPGGKVELGETPEQAVIRETREETGLVVDNPLLIDVVSQVILDGNGRIKHHFIIIDYFVRLRTGRPQASSDAASLEWVPMNEAQNKDLTASFRSFFHENFDRLKKMDSGS